MDAIAELRSVSACVGEAPSQIDRRQHRADDPLGEARVELAAVQAFLRR